MPTKYTDQFYVIDPYNGTTVGATLTPQLFDFFDNDDNGIIQPNAGDTVLEPGSDPEVFNEITAVYVGDTVTVLIGGVSQVIVGTTFYISGQPAMFTPNDGTILQTAEFVESDGVPSSTEMPVGDFGPPCFTPGTLIDTPDGQRLIEDLRPGDLVMTSDNGPQPLLWVGSRTVPGTGRFTPIHFKTGAIGNTEPLLVSPQHRMLVEGWKAELMFGETSVLVPAKSLINERTIVERPQDEVTYIHLLFAKHEIIVANDAESESYFIGHLSQTNEQGTRAEVLDLFPELTDQVTALETARPVMRATDCLALSAYA